MSSLIDLTGKVFGNWTVLSKGERIHGQTKWLCRCVCGTEKLVLGLSLRGYESRSCGCSLRDIPVRRPEDYIRKPGNYDKRRDYKLRSAYGITTERYNELFQKQNGKCAVCKKNQTDFKRAFAVDHDYKTGKIRGLLCVNCNMALGYIKDEVFILEELLKYLIDARE